MTEPTVVDDPIHAMQKAAGADFLTYGSRELVESFGEYEAEYAMIRKGVGLLDQPQLGVVKVTGKDRADFLHRFVTNQVNGLKVGEVRRAFLLTRAGRIAADMLIVAMEDHHLLLLDAVDAQTVTKQLDQFLFSEEVKIEDGSAAHRVLALHGLQGAALLNALGATNAHELLPAFAQPMTLAGKETVVVRQDITGSPGLQIVANASEAMAIYQAMVEQIGGLLPEVQGGVRRAITGRGIGWMALNTARIEAGHAMYHIDFGPDSLPHESSTIPQTVSFTKGCYLGQEIVARMHNLGHPKKLLVGLVFEDDRLPLAGAQIFDNDGATIIGAVTSSCLSPLKGNVAIAMAMMKWGKHHDNQEVLVVAEGAKVKAKVGKLQV